MTRIQNELARMEREGLISRKTAVDRIWRVGGIADRYEMNILDRATKTKAYKDTLKKLQEARKSGDAEAFNRAYSANAKVVNKAYSRHTYMGNSNG